jgi:hypothetical protein
MIKTSHIVLPSLAGLFLAASLPALAAAPTVKVLAEDATIQVLDVVEHPGDVGAVAKRTGNIIYVISGGTLERSFADGTKTTATRKAGEAAIVTETRPYGVKNIGTTTVHLIEVIKK